MANRAQLAAEIVAVAHGLHARAWVANHDGNVSVRLPDDRFLVTPTAISKADATEGGLAVTDAAGEPVEGEARPPSEFALHLGAYAARPDVRAVVHAHPPHATALACVGQGIDVFLAEAVVSLGATVPITPWALPSGEAGAAPVRAAIVDCDALILGGHGVITVGPCLELALLRMELVEHLARIQLLAAPLGGPQKLSEDVLRALLGKRRAAAGLLGDAAARSYLPGEGPGSQAPGGTAAIGASAWPKATSPVVTPSFPPVPARPGPRLEPQPWTPAGPAPARDAWSGGKTEGACGVVYGAGPAPVAKRSDAPADLGDRVASEVRRILGS
jgi:L-fuculose-phosphate aldolase